MLVGIELESRYSNTLGKITLPLKYSLSLLPEFQNGFLTKPGAKSSAELAGQQIPTMPLPPLPPALRLQMCTALLAFPNPCLHSPL